MEKREIEEILIKSIEAALKAGEEILKVFYSSNFEVEYKSDNSPVTVADIRASKIIENALAPFNYPYLSEEEEIPPYNERKKWDRFWMVDPLDGTKEFVNNGKDFTVNIALIENNYPVIGTIYIPMEQSVYFGAKGYGAFKAERVKSSSPEDIISNALPLPLMHKKDKFTLVGSRSHMTQETEDYYKQIKDEKGHDNVEIIIRGSSLKMCTVAEGRADLYPRLSNIMEWDIAAGHAICEAAGCAVTQWDGTKLAYNKENFYQPWFIVKKSPGFATCHPSFNFFTSS